MTRAIYGLLFTATTSDCHSVPKKIYAELNPLNSMLWSLKDHWV